jgi:hypothetical protein
MAGHLLSHREEPRLPSHRPPTQLMQLRWSDFWLLSGILVALLALVALVAWYPGNG